MRHGTWTETSGGPGGGGLGAGLVIAVLVGLWLAASAKPASQAPAADNARHAPVREVAAHAAHGGHGFGWWALVVAGLVLAFVVLTIAGLVLYDWTVRRHDTTAVDSPAAVPTVQDTSLATSARVVDRAPEVSTAPASDTDVSSAAEVVHLDTRRRAAGGDVA